MMVYLVTNVYTFIQERDTRYTDKPHNLTLPQQYIIMLV